MDLTNTQLVLVLIVVPFVLCAVVFVGLLALDDLRAKRRARRVDPLRLDGRPLVDCPGDVWHGLPYAPGVGPEPDPVEQAYADTGFVSVDDRIRATAAADAAEAAFVTPGCRDADAFLAELFPRTKDAPKEQT